MFHHFVIGYVFYECDEYQIGISEVKPKHHRYAPTAASYSIDNYVMFHKNITNTTGRGVILYVHESLQPNEVIIKVNSRNLYVLN